MSTYSASQVEALCQARQLLKEAGLTKNDLLEDFSSSPPRLPPEMPAAINFSSGTFKLLSREEIEKGEGRITRKVASSVHAIIEHTSNAIVEFPESGSSKGSAVAHIFPIDPKDWVHPKDNFQYSLDDKHGQHNNVRCRLLDRYSVTNTPVLCTKLERSCRSTKHCPFTDVNDIGINAGHTTGTMPDADKEVFTKTLGFFAALMERGCRLDSLRSVDVDETEGSDDTVEEDKEEEEEELIWLLTNSRASNRSKNRRCNGKFILEFEKNNRPWIRCEHYESGRQGHLALLNIGEFDLSYLGALMSNDWTQIRKRELEALSNGYGPLATCGITCAYRDQKELCPSWHRGIDGKLQRGELVKTNDCPAYFEIYHPNDLHDCPYILVVCRNPHSHPNPPRTRTPASIRIVFNEILYRLDWRLADSTPRRLLLDNGFMTDLRRILNWHEVHDPTLADLHPSFANHDHAGRLIDSLRSELYPEGTGWEGARYLIEAHPDKHIYQKYIRHIDEHQIPDGTIRLVICMFPAMSRLFHQTKRPSIDTSFKRLHQWQEFEIESWFPEFSRSLVLARAFTTSQTAEAHQILFRQMFRIVEEDTGKAVHFRHIHSDGFETITADGHRGQALGLGLYLQEICKHEQKISPEWAKPLSFLMPTEHLACIFRYCLTHYFRNITNLKNTISKDVRAAMISLASPERLPNYEEVLKCIRRGGKKAVNWLEDKEASNNMTLAGIYRPLSKIPIEIWKAAPTTSNGNEQAHRNINRDGTQLTILAGVMRGLQYDSRAIQSCNIFMQEGIPVRDQDPTSFRRSRTAIGKKERGQRKIVELKDSQIAQVNQTIIKQQQTVRTNAQGVKRAMELKSPEKIETAVKRLRNANDMLQKNNSKLEKLVLRGSGRVVPSGILPAQELFNHKLLDMPAEQEPTNTKSTTIPTSSAASAQSHIWSGSQTSIYETHPNANLNPYPSFSQPRNPAFINTQAHSNSYPWTHITQYNPTRHTAEARPSNPYPLPPLTQHSQPQPSYPFDTE